jgi:hypothetical protein
VEVEKGVVYINKKIIIHVETPILINLKNNYFLERS